jgi:hypothetical protein
MSEETTHSSGNRKGIFRLDELRREKELKIRHKPQVRVKVEVMCREQIGRIIQQFIVSELESRGCLDVQDDKPDWILSLIAFSHGEMVELSIVLRALFRSTTPGTEVDRIESDGNVVLREGGWLYESLRFHGLYGVPRADLGRFLGQLVSEFKAEHWDPNNTHESRVGPTVVKSE